MQWEVGSALNIASILAAVIVIAAMLIWVERRLLGFWQDRLGPNRVGPFGLLQVVADMIKIFHQRRLDSAFLPIVLVFVLAPTIIMIVILLSFSVVPFAPGVGIVDSNIGVLFVLAMASLGAYSVMLGAFLDNKYALLGSLRAAAQMVSYEVFMGISLLGVVALAGSFNLREIVLAQEGGWFVVPQFIGFIIFLIAGVAESHRLPFDIPEAEQEICAGYHTEYSGMKFGMFFVGEYLGLVLISSLITVLFFGG